MLVVSLAAPGAFGSNGVTFGIAYLVVRTLHLVLFLIVGRGDRDLFGSRSASRSRPVRLALGESIFAIGIGAAGLPLDAGVISAAVVRVAVAAALWWSYFDWVAIVAQARLAEATGASRAALARDAYSYLHMPMVAGIVLFALGLKTTLHDVSAALAAVPAVCLCGGVAVYLLAHVALRLRIEVASGTADRSRRSCCLRCCPPR
jgi:low temperature requirement protein LtrA